MLRHCLVLFGITLAMPGFAPADDASRAIVEKAIEKNGGEKLARFRAATARIKGTIQVNGAAVPFTGEIASQGGDQQRIAVLLQIDGQAIGFSSIVNRDKGWQKIGDNTVEMSAGQLAEARAAAYAAWVTSLLPLKDKAFELTPFGEIDMDGRKAIGVNVTRDGQRSVTLFFDKETGRLVRSETVVKDDFTFKDVTEQSTYSDVKAFDGVEYHSKVAIKRDGVTHADVEVEHFKRVEKHEESMFSAP